MSRRSTDTDEGPRVWILLTKRKFIDMIMDGQKLIEIRWEGTHNLEKLRPGDYVLLVAKVADGVLGVAKIVDVMVKSLADITEEEARLAGFSSKAELLEELCRIYQVKSLDERYYLIKLVPLLDLRLRPVKLSRLRINLTYWDIKGKIVGVPSSTIKRILRYVR